MTRMTLTSWSLIAALTGVAAGGGALADDTNTDRPAQTHKQMMHDCMVKERSANSGASEDDMKKTCREKIKSYENQPSETHTPPNNPGTP